MKFKSKYGKSIFRFNGKVLESEEIKTSDPELIRLLKENSNYILIEEKQPVKKGKK